MIRIRRARPESAKDYAAIAALQAETLPGDAPCLVKDDDIWHLAFLDGKPVAFSCVRPTYQDPKTWYLARVGVAPAARGQGLQKRLIRVRLRAAAKAGAEWVVTDTTRQNHPSSNSLMAEGFRLYEPAYKWAFSDGLYWRKRVL
jgi:GNAT superfamily N-acetyltransferase